MLSINGNGLPLAYIRGGEDDESLIVYNNESKNDEEEALISTIERLCLSKTRQSDRQKGGRPETREKIRRLIDHIRVRKVPDKNDSIYSLYQFGIGILDASVGSDIYIPEGELRVMPNTAHQMNDVVYVVGATGSGKSTWIGRFCEDYIKITGNNVFIFSSFERDRAIPDSVMRVPMAKLEEALHNGNFPSWSDYHDCLIVVDDLSSVNKQLEKAVNKFKDDVAKLGRKNGVSLIYSSHIFRDGTISKQVINDCRFAVLFPMGMNESHIRHCCEKVVGMSGKDVKRIVSLPSRWVAVFKIPKVVCHERGCYKL